MKYEPLTERLTTILQRTLSFSGLSSVEFSSITITTTHTNTHNIFQTLLDANNLPTFYHDTQPSGTLTPNVESGLSAGQLAPPPPPLPLHYHALATWSCAEPQRRSESSGFCLTCMIGLIQYTSEWLCNRISSLAMCRNISAPFYFSPCVFQAQLTCDCVAYTRLELDFQTCKQSTFSQPSKQGWRAKPRFLQKP